MATPVPVFSDNVLRTLCAILADTNSGLTGGEIDELLTGLGLEVPHASRQIQGATVFGSLSKAKRLTKVLAENQTETGTGNYVVAFIHRALDPVRYVGNHAVFARRRDELNVALALAGYVLAETGRLQKVRAATTLSEAEQRANRLRAELTRRGVHGDVLKYCAADFLRQDYFDAVLETSKSLAEKIRQRTGVNADGAQLFDLALSPGAAGIPFLAFNSLQTKSEESEQSGLTQLLKGVFGAFRNPQAHDPKIRRSVSEHDALDLLTLASYLHRRIDAAARTHRTN
jgi:uncharacterized protein (TIGR02391 family)